MTIEDGPGADIGDFEPNMAAYHRRSLRVQQQIAEILATEIADIAATPVNCADSKAERLLAHELQRQSDEVGIKIKTCQLLLEDLAPMGAETATAEPVLHSVHVA